MNILCKTLYYPYLIDRLNYEYILKSANANVMHVRVGCKVYPVSRLHGAVIGGSGNFRL